MGNCWGALNESQKSLRTTKPPSSTVTPKNNSDEGVTIRKNRVRIDKEALSTADDDKISETPNVRIFSFGELRSATKNFRPDMVLGEGGFGKVFKGCIDEKTYYSSSSSSSSSLSSSSSSSSSSKSIGSSSGSLVIAVKKLNRESLQGLQEWQSEVNFLGRLSHPNLVKLLGYCWDHRELLLVYEFMPKGSLENHLFRKGSAVQPLLWRIRLKIAIGAAQGLAYLHSSEKQVIYRDFKASNILLDGNFNAKLSDFGLAKNGPIAGDSHVTTRVMGTNGYVAPEYVATGHLYVKSDVYGFGVVLLEMLTGQRALDTNRPNGQYNLVDWSKPNLCKPRKLRRIMDPRLEGQYPPKAATQAGQLVLRCLEPDPRKRPSMNEVVEALQKVEAMNIEERP